MTGSCSNYFGADLRFIVTLWYPTLHTLSSKRFCFLKVTPLELQAGLVRQLQVEGKRSSMPSPTKYLVMHTADKLSHANSSETTPRMEAFSVHSVLARVYEASTEWRSDCMAALQETDGNHLFCRRMAAES